MERQALSPEIESWVADRRAYHIAAADAGEDNGMPPKDRRNRAYVLGPKGRVQPDDDVKIGDEPIRVICAAPSEEWFYGLSQTPWGLLDVPYNGRDINDRAPLDPLEVPLPIFIDDEPEPTEPPPEGTVVITTQVASHDHAATMTTTIDDEGIHTSMEPTP